MALTLATATQNAGVEAMASLVDNDTNEGVLRIYSGTRPSSANDGVGGADLLAEVELSDPAWDSPSAGEVNLLGTPLNTVGITDGTATWFRLLDGGDNTVFDGDVGTSNDDLVVTTTSIVEDVGFSITSGVFRVPSGE